MPSQPPKTATAFICVSLSSHHLVITRNTKESDNAKEKISCNALSEMNLMKQKDTHNIETQHQYENVEFRRKNKLT